MELPGKPLDRKLNFGCGAVLGFFVSFLGAASSGNGLLESLAIASFVAVTFGVLTVIFGDRFLERMVKWLSWM
ncbi:MAG TPA: hypothetical protein VJ725_18960 [Thermoanaerobaculia bacterium]|nr:hypothetical protein [Thermoanaerobaculia bacterium]